MVDQLQAKPTPVLWRRKVAGFDADASAYFDAAEAAGGNLDMAGKSAFSDFVTGCKNDGVWSLIVEMGVFIGWDALSAILVKLKAGPGSPAMLTNLNFVGGDYVAAGAGAGLKGASGKRLNFGRGITFPNTLAYYATEHPATNAVILGVGGFTQATPPGQSICRMISGTVTGARSANAAYLSTATNSTGLWVATSSAADDHTLFLNGLSAATSSQSVAVTDVSDLIAFSDGSGGVPFLGRLSAAIYAAPMTAPQVVALSARLNALMTAFGANAY